ncbi:DUF819 domain-containing protein [Pseudoscourfieldia marina]
MVATVVGLVAASFGLVPDNAPAYDVVNRYLVPLSVPLLLLSSDLRRVLKETGSLLRVFVLGSIGTLAGTVAAYAVVPLHATKLGADAGWSIATALCARHIGGAVNYVSVTEALNVPAKSVAAGLAADNCVCALYFASLFALAAVADKELLRRKDSTQDVSEAATTSGSEGERTTSPIDTQTVSIAVAFSAACCFVSSRIAAALGQGGEAWTLPIVTAISVVAATAFPKRLGALEKGGNLVANVLLGFFFACVGARGSVATVMGEAPALFAYSMVQIAVHFVVLYALNAATIKAPLRDLLLASNANVGGPTTAVSMANARRWESSKVPALLVGVFGYAMATFLSLALGIRVLKPWAFS